MRALQNVTVSQDVARLLGSAGNGFRKLAYENMRARNWPSETLENEGFVDARWPQSRKGKRKVSILFGFGKRNRPGYVEWYGRKQGRKIGMSLLTLYEFGGVRKDASPWCRPAWRPAIVSYKKTARSDIREGVSALLKRYTVNG